MKTAFSLWMIAYKNIHKPTNELATELKSHLLYEKITPNEYCKKEIPIMVYMV